MFMISQNFVLLHKTKTSFFSPGSPPHSLVPPQSKVTANKYWNETARLVEYHEDHKRIDELDYHHNHLDKLAFSRHLEGRIVVNVLLYSNLAV